MIGQWTNHLWQSTLFAVVVALVTLAFRRNRANVRYCLWLSASFKFLVPFALLMNLGNSLWSAFAARQIATELAPPAVSLAIQQIAQPFTDSPLFVPSTPLTHTADWIPIVLLGLWICGFLGVLLVRIRGWLRIRGAMRVSRPIDIRAAAAVRTSPGLLEPGVVGVLRPVLLLPEDISKRLSPSQLEAVLAHELSHVRRRDNLTAAIHMVVEAVFWFHPFVWWIGARLVEERERACDEAVLSLGGEPRDYADAIVSVCKLYIESPLTCVSGISGADLKKRIVRIMARHVGLRMSLGRKLLLCAAGLLAVAVPVVFGVLHATQTRAQSQVEDSANKLPEFEVASIRPDHSGSGLITIGAPGHGAPEDRFIAKNTTIKGLICWAWATGYSLPWSGDRVSGGPGWIDSERYDIDAKLEDSQVAALEKLAPPDRLEQIKLMVQSLLADRFGLAVKNTTLTVPVFALVVTRGGPKLQEIVPGSPSPKEFEGHSPGVLARVGEIRGYAIPVSTLAQWISQDELGRPVVDRTGLKGKYDFDLKWTPDFNGSRTAPGPSGMMPGPSSGAEPALPDASGPSIFTAVQEQLGLKLESTKGPEEAITIAHIEKPSPN